MQCAKNTKTLISIDFETLGTEPDNSLVLALGMVIGNTTGTIYYKNEFIFPLVEQLDTHGIDPETVKWWCETKDKFVVYKDYMGECSTQTHNMEDVVLNIYNTIKRVLDLNTPYKMDNKDILFCAKPPSFDCAFLSRLFNQYLPVYSTDRFTFRQEFDMTTINKLCAGMPPYPEKLITPHNALADAKHQYLNLIYQLAMLDITL